MGIAVKHLKVVASCLIPKLHLQLHAIHLACDVILTEAISRDMILKEGAFGDSPTQA